MRPIRTQGRRRGLGLRSGRRHRVAQRMTGRVVGNVEEARVGGLMEREPGGPEICGGQEGRQPGLRVCLLAGRGGKVVDGLGKERSLSRSSRLSSRPTARPRRDREPACTFQFVGTPGADTVQPTGPGQAGLRHTLTLIWRRSSGTCSSSSSRCHLQCCKSSKQDSQGIRRQHPKGSTESRSTAKFYMVNGRVESATSAFFLVMDQAQRTAWPYERQLEGGRRENLAREEGVEGE